MTHEDGSGGRGGVGEGDEVGGVVVTVASIAVVLIIVGTVVVLYVKCRKNQMRRHSSKLCVTTPNKIDSNALYTTSSTLNSNSGAGGGYRGTAATLNGRSNGGSRIDLNGGFEPRLGKGTKSCESLNQPQTDYTLMNGGSSLHPQSKTQEGSAAVFGSPLLVNTAESRYAHTNGVSGGTLNHNGTLNSRIFAPNSTHHLMGGVGESGAGTSTFLSGPNQNRLSDDPWPPLNGASRETSPASSISPGMPAFRVIPLCGPEGSVGGCVEPSDIGLYPPPQLPNGGGAESPDPWGGGPGGILPLPNEGGGGSANGTL